MDSEQRRAMRKIFPYVEPQNIILLNDDGRPLQPGRENLALSLLGFAPRVPGSLKALCAYTVFKSGQQLSKEDAPEPVRKYLKAFK